MRTPRITRRRMMALGSAGAIAFGVGYARVLEPRWLAVRRVSISLGLASQRPVRIVHLSDLHWSDVVPRSVVASAVEQAVAAKPDLVCLTGDFITAGDGRSWDGYAEMLRRLTAAAPCVASLGNHDGGQWSAARGGQHDIRPVTELLEKANVRILVNQAYDGPGGLRLVGLADLWAGNFAPEVAFDRSETDASRKTIVLAHNPDTKDRINHYVWDLMLSGHTHGGQVVVPFYGPPLAPVRDLRFVAGLKSWNDRQIYVSRGVGNLQGVRFNCRPEIAILEIE